MRISFPIRNGIVTLLCGIVCLGSQIVAASTQKKKPTTAASESTTKPASKSPAKRRSRSKAKKGAKSRGQKAIESERAQQIQEALIREHYMNGTPSGKWDDATQAALRRYQADQGWQSKSVPDSRALIKLGLGPSHDHLLNPESAMTSAPVPITHKSSKAAAGDTGNPANTSAPDGVPQQ